MKEITKSKLDEMKFDKIGYETKCGYVDYKDIERIKKEQKQWIDKVCAETQFLKPNTWEIIWYVVKKLPSILYLIFQIIQLSERVRKIGKRQKDNLAGNG